LFSELVDWLAGRPPLAHAPSRSPHAHLTTPPCRYALDSSGELRVNVSSLWEYFTETGELPVLPPDLISVFGDVVRSLDFEGTADLFRNETFLDSFISQVNSTFPAWVDRFDQLLQSRQSFLDGLGLGTGADSAGSQGNTVALVVGIVLAVVAVLVVGVGAFLFVRERRKRARAVVVLDGRVLTIGGVNSTHAPHARTSRSHLTLALTLALTLCATRTSVRLFVRSFDRSQEHVDLLR
jgi:hypothetical protein